MVEASGGSNHSVRHAACGSCRPVVAITNHAVSSAAGRSRCPSAQGDAVLGQPMADWRAALAIGRQVCQQADLPFDELTERLFSRVGSMSQPSTAAGGEEASTTKDH
jgi:hypothetical protein